LKSRKASRNKRRPSKGHPKPTEGLKKSKKNKAGSGREGAKREKRKDEQGEKRGKGKRRIMHLLPPLIQRAGHCHSLLP